MKEQLEKYLKARVKLGKWKEECADAHRIKAIKRLIKGSKGVACLTAQDLLKKFSYGRLKFRQAYSLVDGSMEDVLASAILSLIELHYHKTGKILLIEVSSKKNGYWTFLTNTTKSILEGEYIEALQNIKGYAIYRKCDIDTWIKVRVLHELDILAEI